VALKFRFGIIWKLGYGLLFAFHSNYGSILKYFLDKARYWSKIAIFHTTCIRRPRSRGPRLNIATPFAFGTWKLNCVATRRWQKFEDMRNRSDRILACDRRTDGQKTSCDGTSALCMASRGKNREKCTHEPAAVVELPQRRRRRRQFTIFSPNSGMVWSIRRALSDNWTLSGDSSPDTDDDDSGTARDEATACGFSHPAIKREGSSKRDKEISR